MHQKSTSTIARKCGKTSNLLVQLAIGCTGNSIADEISEIVLSFTIMSKDFKIITEINLYGLLCFVLHTVLTCIKSLQTEEYK